jgi:hypothetical protein
VSVSLKSAGCSTLLAMTAFIQAGCAGSSAPSIDHQATHPQQTRLSSERWSSRFATRDDQISFRAQSVSLVVNRTSGKTCTGVLVAENELLTSAECASHQDPAAGVQALFAETNGHSEQWFQARSVQALAHSSLVKVQLLESPGRRALRLNRSGLEAAPVQVWSAQLHNNSEVVFTASSCRTVYSSHVMPGSTDSLAARHVLTDCAAEPGSAVIQGGDVRALVAETIDLSRELRSDIRFKSERPPEAVVAQSIRCVELPNELSGGVERGDCDVESGKLRSQLTRLERDPIDHEERLEISRSARRIRDRLIAEWSTSAEPPEGLAFESIPVEASTLESVGVRASTENRYFVPGPRCLTRDFLDAEGPALLEADRRASRPYWLPIWSVSSRLTSDLQWDVTVDDVTRLESRLHFEPTIARGGRRVPVDLVVQRPREDGEAIEELILLNRIVDECGTSDE